MSDAPLARVETRQSGDTTMVRLLGEIDLSNAAEILTKVEAAFGDAGGSALLDLSGVEYLDSQGVRLVHTVMSHTKKSGLNVTLLAPPDGVVRDILTLSGVAFETTDADPENSA